MSTSLPSTASEDRRLDEISRPPTTLDIFVNRTFRGSTFVFAWLTIFLVVLILVEIGGTAAPAFGRYGFGLLSSTDWDPSTDNYGILPHIWGTLYSSILGLIIGSTFGVAIAIFLSQDFLPARVEIVLKNVIELLAAIPSVVYGLWGIFVLVPMLIPVADWLHTHVGWIPIFSTRLNSRGMLPASIVLGIMILPTISAISRDSLASVHPKLKEAALGLGATKWETILAVILPTASTGIFGAMVIGFGRALGETMALAMLVGSMNTMSVSLFSPGNTLAALLANQFPEADTDGKQVLMYAALVLLLITLLVNFVGAAVMNRAAAKLTGVSR